MEKSSFISRHILTKKNTGMSSHERTMTQKLPAKYFSCKQFETWYTVLGIQWNRFLGFNMQNCLTKRKLTKKLYNFAQKTADTDRDRPLFLRYNKFRNFSCILQNIYFKKTEEKFCCCFLPKEKLWKLCMQLHVQKPISGICAIIETGDGGWGGGDQVHC